jgi:acyl-CoA synthetase (AMP-forming)/AMP-acid ligase II
MIVAFRMGARLVLERSFAFPVQILQTMVDEQVTDFAGVPTIFAMIADIETAKTAFDFSRMRRVTNAAAALPVKHLQFLRELFPRADIVSMYGQTECQRVCYLPPDQAARKPASVGIAIPNTEVWIVDEQDRRLPPGQVGQLVVRGGHVMRGYWEKPELTAGKLRPGPLPGEQVLYTGDSFRADEEGFLYFVGRMDEMIKTRGEKVAPREVEQALLAIPGVKEAAVIGVPDELLGQAIKAFLVLQAGATLSEQELRRECQQRIEPFMVPRQLAFVSSLPRTASGKVRKVELA